MTSPRRPVEVIGILGGGQLGRMLAVAASRLGLTAVVLAPDPDPIAGAVASRSIQADYLDAAALAAFADAVDVVTYEFENVPAAALDVLQDHCPVLPGRRALAVSQDRLVEKDFLAELGLRTTRYANVDDVTDLETAVEKVGTPAILKTRRFGYDGKGQCRVDDPASAGDAWDAIARAPAILEGVVTFEREISVIAARSADGRIVAYDPGENVHRDGILRTTTVPAPISDALAAQARAAAATLLDALDYVGVIGVELFVADGDLLVNEFAPRVHNSGHWTQNGCVIDQFEQHIRAIAGWPLGDGRRHSDVVMTNLIGDDVDRLDQAWDDPDVGVHLYGKAEARPGRKMGHLNRVVRRDG